MTGVADYRDVTIFEGLTDAEIAEVLEGSQPIQLEAGQAVFKEGEPGDGLFIIASGKCMVRRKAGDKEIDLAPLDRHAAVGEMGVLAQKGRMASIYATEPTVALKVTRERFGELLAKGSCGVTKVVCNIARMLSGRLDKLNSQFGALTQKVEKETKKEAVQDLRKFKDQLYKEWAF